MVLNHTLKIEINAFKCQRCAHEWIPRVSMDELKIKIKKEPIICPSCKSPYWKTKRKIRQK